MCLGPFSYVRKVYFRIAYLVEMTMEVLEDDHEVSVNVKNQNNNLGKPDQASCWVDYTSVLASG